MKKNALTLNIDALCADPCIRSLDAELQIFAKEHANKDILSEGEVSLLGVESFSIREPLFDQYVCPSLPEALADLQERPQAHECLQKVWKRPFRGKTFAIDVEALASSLLGQTMRIRDFDVAAQDRVSKQITARYPSAKQVQAGIPILENLISKKCCDLPFLSAFIAMIYFYRLHPLPDGNGRTSRAIINICLRNYGLITKPTFLISPILIRYLPQIEPMIRKGEGVAWQLFARLLKIAIMAHSLNHNSP